MEHLINYLKQSGIPQARFAEAVGITQSSLSKMCAGIIKPSLKTAVRIEAETAGAVPASSWMDEPQAKAS